MITEFEIFEKAMKHADELLEDKYCLGPLAIGDIVGTLLFARELIGEGYEELNEILNKRIGKMMIKALQMMN